MTTNPIFQTYTFQLKGGSLVNDSTLQEFLRDQLKQLMSKIESQSQLQNGTYSVVFHIAKVRDENDFPLDSINQTFEERFVSDFQQRMESHRLLNRNRTQNKD